MRAEFKDDPYIYAFDSLKHIGIELWQVIDYSMTIMTFLVIFSDAPLIFILYIILG